MISTLNALDGNFIFKYFIIIFSKQKTCTIERGTLKFANEPYYLPLQCMDIASGVKINDIPEIFEKHRYINVCLNHIFLYDKTI